MCLPGISLAAERKTLLIAGGEVTGYYFPVAGAICRVINKDRPHGFGCAVVPSSGSAANLDLLRTGEVDLALVQSRAAQLAAAGEEGFKGAGPMPDLRALMALHGEVSVVLTRPGAGIEQLGDLKGKRVNLGRPGSFQRAMAETVIDASGLSQGDLSVLVELDLAEQGAELCQGNIDAAVFTGVHPMVEVQTAVEECGATLVSIRSKSMDTFLRKVPSVSRFVVKGGTYDGQKEDVAAIGLKTLLVTKSLSNDDAADVVKAVWSNFGAFTRLHPALRGLSKADATRDGIPIRMHEGAQRIHGEAGH
ncbi:C4-dicarboxylate ABC transporter [Paramagnetospirillum kuznetsovii]|uniref:C4-dicarboxylate ABC transporter n=2 Tax=Paramagnetospirillum kuznetsovii TaxID=2053833 RepID=A0A364NXA4_9PROT|nr:C4-dicarboxylate ABC transporter [Paramagnetospirillum kuznetsovii]